MRLLTKEEELYFGCQAEALQVTASWLPACPVETFPPWQQTATLYFVLKFFSCATHVPGKLLSGLLDDPAC